MNGPPRVKFYQTGTFTIGNRLLDPAAQAVQAATDRSNSLNCGHRACQGCGEALGARYALDAAMRLTGNRIIVANATGCLEVFSTPYPESSWQVAWLHSLFGNAPAVGTGIAAALKVKGKTDVRVIAQGGDGGTVDIGFGCLSGMFERNDDVLYICYDNEAYEHRRAAFFRHAPAARTSTPAGRSGTSSARARASRHRDGTGIPRRHAPSPNCATWSTRSGPWRSAARYLPSIPVPAGLRKSPRRHPVARLVESGCSPHLEASWRDHPGQTIRRFRWRISRPEAIRPCSPRAAAPFSGCRHPRSPTATSAASG